MRAPRKTRTESVTLNPADTAAPMTSAQSERVAQAKATLTITPTTVVASSNRRSALISRCRCSEMTDVLVNPSTKGTAAIPSISQTSRLSSSPKA